MAGNGRDEFTPVAEQVPFDNDTNGFISEDVQAAIEEVKNTVETTALPGFSYGRSGNTTANTWLLNNQVPSNIVGVPVGTTNPVITEIWAGSENLDTYDIEVHEHDGDEINLSLLTTVSVVAQRTATFNISVNTTKNKQLAVKLVNGSAKNVKTFILVKGSL